MIRILHGDTIETLRTLPADSVHCIVTSPPFWGLRDYGTAGQYGLETTLAEYVERMVAVGRELRRVLRPDGVMWWEHGDSYAANRSYQVPDSKHCDVGNNLSSRVQCGLKPKDLIGQPWRVALALQDDGWYLRAANIWHKPNPMPESVTDRTTTAHSYVFMFAKSERYFYEAEAVKGASTRTKFYGSKNHAPNDRNDCGRTDLSPAGKSNLRSVWTIATEPCSEAHFAVMASEVARRCIAAGCPPGGTVLDPFSGAGTTAMVADRLGRDAIGIELSAEYIAIAEKRIARDRLERKAGTMADVAKALQPTPLEALL